VRGRPWYSPSAKWSRLSFRFQAAQL